MTQQLYLLRHAQAESWSPLGNDFSRALDVQGRRHAQLLADWSLKTIAPPDTVLCSAAKRTRETLAPLLANWPGLLANTNYEDVMYGASLHMLLTLAEDAFSYSQCLLMVGHNPAIENMLFNFFRQEQAIDIQKMDTGTLAVIEFSDCFKRNSQTAVLKTQVQKQDIQTTDAR